MDRLCPLRRASKTLIYWTAAALGIASVSSGFSVRTGAFIKIYAKSAGVCDDVNRTIHISFVIRVLYAQIEYASGLMGQPFIGKGPKRLPRWMNPVGLGPRR